MSFITTMIASIVASPIFTSAPIQAILAASGFAGATALGQVVALAAIASGVFIAVGFVCYLGMILRNEYQEFKCTQNEGEPEDPVIEPKDPVIEQEDPYSQSEKDVDSDSEPDLEAPEPEANKPNICESKKPESESELEDNNSGATSTPKPK